MLLTAYVASTVDEVDGHLVSAIETDFPHVSEPGAPTGYTVSESKVAYGWTHNVDNRTIGRDDEGEVVWVKLSDIPTYHNVVSQQGVRSQSDILIIDKAGIQFAIVEAVFDHTIATSVHNSANHEIIAALLHSSEDPELVPPALETALAAWDPDIPFTTERLIALRDFLVARGVPLEWLQDWAGDNPGATPRIFYRDLRKWATS